MENIPDYGDLMTLQEFIKSCHSGLFTDYDGFGNYSDGKMMSEKEVSPSDITFGIIDRKWSHIVWFNR